jgi:hypothetical protein
MNMLFSLSRKRHCQGRTSPIHFLNIFKRNQIHTGLNQMAVQLTPTHMVKEPSYYQGHTTFLVFLKGLCN